jgi:ribonuclease P protein component
MTPIGDGDIAAATAAQAARPGVARPNAAPLQAVSLQTAPIQVEPIQVVPIEVERLKKRADFLGAAKGRRQHQRCFVLQARARNTDAEPAGAPRFGFTLTKKVGNSVVRNRIRRRLREVVRLADPALPRPGHDYVVVARIEALSASFDDLRGDLARALKKIHPAGDTRRPQASPAADLKQDV